MLIYWDYLLVNQIIITIAGVLLILLASTPEYISGQEK